MLSTVRLIDFDLDPGHDELTGVCSMTSARVFVSVAASVAVEASTRRLRMYRYGSHQHQKQRQRRKWMERMTVDGRNECWKNGQQER